VVILVIQENQDTLVIQDLVTQVILEIQEFLDTVDILG